ncbi:hypothetical protein ACFL6X_07990 [Candidatus Latescibacterota bacterium]
MKELMLGVDYADNVEHAFRSGELGDTPVIEAIMDDAAAAGMTSVAWRVSHLGKLTYRTRAGTAQDGHKAIRASLTPFGLILQRIDPLEVAVRAAHERGLKLFVYYCLFDEAYLDLTTDEVSESDFGRLHPDMYWAHHSTKHCLRGVLSFGYPEVREYFGALVREGLSYGVDGVYLDCGRTHAGANPIPVYGWAPQWTNPYLAYGYNEPDVARYRAQYGEPPPVVQVTDTGGQEVGEAEDAWNRARGEGLTQFMREVRPLFAPSGQELVVCFYPATYNGFNPGYQCRQILGHFHLDWPAWVDEDLVDGVRLNVDHRRFGYDDWVKDSSRIYAGAQARGKRVLVDGALDARVDQLADPPRPLPIRQEDDADYYFGLVEEMVTRMLSSSADGVFFYEHCNTDSRFWEAIRHANARAGTD